MDARSSSAKRAVGGRGGVAFATSTGGRGSSSRVKRSRERDEYTDGAGDSDSDFNESYPRYTYGSTNKSLSRGASSSAFAGSSSSDVTEMEQEDGISALLALSPKKPINAGDSSSIVVGGFSSLMDSLVHGSNGDSNQGAYSLSQHSLLGGGISSQSGMSQSSHSLSNLGGGF
jgi:hypothetical protein